MLNLYSFEQMVLDRQSETSKQYRQRSLLRQAAEVQPVRADSPAPGSSVRSRLGLMFVRTVAWLSGATLVQKPTGTRECVCVPVKG